MISLNISLSRGILFLYAVNSSSFTTTKTKIALLVAINKVNVFPAD